MFATFLQGHLGTNLFLGIFLCSLNGDHPLKDVEKVVIFLGIFIQIWL
jgi:hypothetical protein